MTEAQTEDPESIRKAWQMHEKAIGVIREHLAKEGATIQVDIVIRDKAATERRAKRLARMNR